MLIEGGAKINAVDGDGESPLFLAARLGFPTGVEARKKTHPWSALTNLCDSIFQVLLENGAAVDGRNSFGETPLMLAAFKGRLKVVEASFAPISMGTGTRALISRL